MFTGEGASEEIVLKDGTRIRIKETILEDGSRQIVRETVDAWGNKQVEAESYRETFDAESFLSIEQRTRYGHSSRSKDGTTASSSGWEGQPESRGNRTNHHRSYQDGTTLTSGWVTEEHGMGESSTYYTRSNESKSPKHKYYDDGLALSPSKTNRQYAKQSTSRISEILLILVKEQAIMATEQVTVLWILLLFRHPRPNLLLRHHRVNLLPFQSPADRPLGDRNPLLFSSRHPPQNLLARSSTRNLDISLSLFKKKRHTVLLRK